VTGPEHCILGAVLSHLGFHQRWGARVTGVMVLASIVPDGDSLTLLAGRLAFYAHHRTLFHSLGGIVVASLLMAGLAWLAAVLGSRMAGRADAEARLHRWAGYLGERGPANPLRNARLIFAASLLAMAAHLGMDALFPWPIPLFWPFSSEAVGLPIIDWGDKVTLAVLLAGMFGLGTWRRHTRMVAILTVAALGAYLVFRAFNPVPGLEHYNA